MEIYTFGEVFEKEAGYPTYQLHRADLHSLLHGVASPIVDLRFGCEVISVDASELMPSVVLKNKEIIQADLIVGADGVHSIIREALGNSQIPIPTNGCVHRVLLPAEDLMKDPELRPLIENPGVLSWIGPQSNSVVGYGIRGKSLYNLVVNVRGDMQDLFTAKGDPNAMREAFQDSDSPWDPRVHKLLSLVKSDHVLKWRMLQSEPLDRWVHMDGPITLLGDACHIFPPRYGQGANLAIEDAAVFGNLFSRITDRRQIKALLHAYEEIRRPRTTAMRQDVMERLARRSALRLSASPEHHTKDVVRPLMMEHRKAHELTIPVHCSHDFGYDADEVVDIWWAEHGREIENLLCQT
ncbi:FAD/NAD(P)-binding domain-containing protein [Marasmius fiardii PR-910]|nr:FAD/NAD(P)-binding domain-containing protein [Marasmius fiardii PR-910]